jgi:hypothetical protein
MRQFLSKSILFLLFLVVLSEIVIRVFHLVPDIPERFIDENNIQRYKVGQTGHYTKAKEPWSVNEYGWLGVSDTSKETIISIIGDSYIENMMNPFECNQGNVLKTLLPENSFFEAGRSGVTFIEAMEISRVLDSEIKPQLQLLYLSTNDFTESISEIRKYDDRVQISLDSNEIRPSKLKSPRLKKILYNFKLGYYLYLKYPIFVNKQNKGVSVTNSAKKIENHKLQFKKLFEFCEINYQTEKLIFAFHPGIDMSIVKLADEYNIKNVLLDSSNDKMWELGKHDKHWSCYGHQQAGKQIAVYLERLIN